MIHDNKAFTLNPASGYTVFYNWLHTIPDILAKQNRFRCWRSAEKRHADCHINYFSIQFYP